MTDAFDKIGITKNNVNRMDNEYNNRQEEFEAIYNRLEALFSGSGLSDEEKRSLSQEILGIIYGSSEEVVR